MKNVNKALIVIIFVIMIVLLYAFSSIYPFTTIGFAWQCAICGFVGLLWIVCLLIEIRKKDI
jgi:membrane associated rhomboid family serine protease